MVFSQMTHLLQHGLPDMILEYILLYLKLLVHQLNLGWVRLCASVVCDSHVSEYT